MLAGGCTGDPAARQKEADRRYRAGIALLAAGDPAAREELRLATELAPMDPSLYLPLARACRDRALEQHAAEYYRKFLAALPDAREAPQARAELAALDADIDVLDTPRLPRWPIAVAAALLFSLGAAWLLLQRSQKRGLTLARLVADNPELQPAIAHLCGCLRHELFKHRIVAVGDAVRALSRADCAAGQREFLTVRLYSGAPLPVAWAGHLASFMRALGPRFDLSRNDPEWKGAGRAVAELASLEVALIRDEPDVAARLQRAWLALEAFDRRLGAQLRDMTHTLVDGALLSEVVETVRAEEFASGADVEISLGDVESGVRVEVYRVDLLLVLKNLLRNAVRAAARGPQPARVAIDLQCSLEPTGEEVVRVRVRDTSPESPPPSSGARRDRGLGIVGDALDRYDGCLEVAPALAPFTKAVCLRLFRSLDVEEQAA